MLIGSLECLKDLKTMDMILGKCKFTASSGTTKPINVSCLATLKLRIIERESEKGVLNFHNSSCHQW